MSKEVRWRISSLGASRDDFSQAFNEIFFGKLSFKERLIPKAINNMRGATKWTPSGAEDADLVAELRDGGGVYILKDSVGIKIGLTFEGDSSGILWMPEFTRYKMRLGLGSFNQNAGALDVYAHGLAGQLVKMGRTADVEKIKL